MRRTNIYFTIIDTKGRGGRRKHCGGGRRGRIFKLKKDPNLNNLLKSKMTDQRYIYNDWQSAEKKKKSSSHRITSVAKEELTEKFLSATIKEREIDKINHKISHTNTIRSYAASFFFVVVVCSLKNKRLKR